MTPRLRSSTSRQSSLRHLWLLLVPLAALAIVGWLRTGLPTSPRGENVPQIAYLWLLRRLWSTGDALGGWNPLILGGEPTVTARLYHLHASLAGLSLLLKITPESLFKSVQLLSNLMGALGCYRLARRLDVSPPGSLVAGVAFIFLPIRVMLTTESLFAALATASGPWLLCGYEQTRVPGTMPRREAVLWGILMALNILTGPQRFLVMIAPVATYVLLREILYPVASRAGRASLSDRGKRLLGIGTIAAVAGAGLALFYMLPTMLGSSELWTSRYLEALPRTSRWSVPPSLAAQLLWQRWSPTFGAFAWDRIGIFPNMTYHLGAVVILLAIMGLANRQQWRATLPLAGMAGLSLLLAFGPQIPHNPAYAVMRRLPLLADTVRNAFRYLIPSGISLGTLGAVGLDSLLRNTKRRWLRAAIALIVVALIVIDFWPVTAACNVTDAYLKPDVVTVHEKLDAMPGDERVWVPFQLESPGQHYADTSYGQRHSRRATINDDEYHSPSAPYRATLYYREALRGQLEADVPLDATSEAILDLSSTRFLVLPLGSDTYRAAAESLSEKPGWTVLTETLSVALLENADTLPAAHAYAEGILVPDLTDVALLDMIPLLKSRDVALVEAPHANQDDAPLSQLCQSVPKQEISSLQPSNRPQVSLAIARPRAGEIWVRYDADDAFFLSLSETWSPQWHVTIDDDAQPLLRMNGNYCGVYVSKGGTGTVQFRYRHPWYVWLGRAISLASLSIVVWVLLKPRPVRLRHDF